MINKIPETDNFKIEKPKFFGQIILDENNEPCLKFSDKFFVIEAITPEQKEAGQREMNKIYINPLKKLRAELIEKYVPGFIDRSKKIKSRPITKEFLIKKNAEKLAFNKILKLMNDMKESDRTAEALYKYATGENDKEYKISKYDSENDVNGTQVIKKGGEYIPYILLDRNAEFLENVNGFTFDVSNEEIKKNIYSFIVKHELGHMYEYLKDRVEKGAAKLVNTITEQDRSKVIDSEGVANAYAIDNMYRKDRRELLKNSEEFNDKSYSQEYINSQKEYLKGTKKHSKTYQKTLDSIRKEKSHFGY